MISFTAHCARNHDRIDFTEPAAFEAHMGTEHGAKMSKDKGAAATRPYPWRAPKAPEGASGLAAVLAAAGDDVSDVEGVPGFITEGTYRYDKHTEAPLEVLPKNVRPLVAGAMARGEMWLVWVKGQQVRVEVGRKVNVNGAKVTEAARVEVWAGKIRKVYTKSDDTHGSYYRESKITEAKALFPAA